MGISLTDLNYRYNNELKFEKGEKYTRKKLKSSIYKNNELFQLLINHNVFIAGGWLTSQFFNNVTSDIDLYFKSKNDLNDFLRYFRVLSTEYDNSRTENSITFYHTYPLPIQVITFITGTPEEMISKFDLSPCQVAYDFLEDKFYYTSEFRETLGTGFMFYNCKALNPFYSLFRLRKYLDRGFNISDVELIKMSMSIASLNLNTFGDLKNLLNFSVSDRTNVVAEIKDYLNESEDINEVPFDLEKLIWLINSKRTGRRYTRVTKYK